jgi:hypothetical protein
MLTDYVALGFVPDGAWAGLRELCGHDEESVCDTDTLTAIQLLDRLLIDGQGVTIGPGCAAKLTAADRDRLLAAVYMRTYGPCVESTLHCRHCDEPFDLDFYLQDLLDSLQGSESAAEKDGVFTLDDGCRFRLPTGEDECAVRHLAPGEAERELLARCTVEGDAAANPDAVQAAMDAIAPVLSLEMNAHCPECGECQPVHFDIQSYLLSMLESEQEQFVREVHRLATAYGWSLEEILGLPRRRRRAYVALVEAEIAGQQEWYR